MNLICSEPFYYQLPTIILCCFEIQSARDAFFFNVSKKAGKPSKSLTSCPTRLWSSFQKLRFGFILVFSKCRLRRRVHSIPLLSKSSRIMTSWIFRLSISARRSRKDLPEVFAEIILPLIASFRSAFMSFCPSTTTRTSFADSDASFSISCDSLSTFLCKRLDKICYLVISISLIFSRFCGCVRK